MSKRKICVVTGTRAEFGLLRVLLNEITDDDDLKLQLVATGMHLSPEFGLTYRDIEKEGFEIAKKVELLLSSDTPVGVSKSIGLGVISFSEVLAELDPDIVLLLGDRFEAFAAAAAAMIARKPIAHIHGGEATEGLIDEPIRHSITKMAQLHFTATETYKRRVIQLGEQPDSVYNTGTPGLDSIENLDLMDRKEFEEAIDFTLRDQNIIVTFHPVTLEKGTSGDYFEELLQAIDQLEDTGIIFTKPNADTDGRIIIQMIDQYVSQHPHKARAFTSLGQLRYLSALQFVDAVVGNSSSGLIEAPSFKTGTVNIGDRQQGRIKADSVITCEASYPAIKEALQTVLSTEFKEKLQTMTNPYGSGGASRKIKKVLKRVDLDGIVKKNFFDISYNL